MSSSSHEKQVEKKTHTLHTSNKTYDNIGRNPFYLLYEQSIILTQIVNIVSYTIDRYALYVWNWIQKSFVWCIQQLKGNKMEINIIYVVFIQENLI